ncbi:MAG: helicase-associated domain-containing protein [Anaerolineae bacterium]
MKTLSQSLLDYEPALLRGIAAGRAVPLAGANQAQIVTRLAEALLSPAALAVVLAELSNEERAALQLLVNHGGQIEGPRFARDYGHIRPMGPARLEREQPWRRPVNPAESLWYKGLIYKAFQLTPEGNLEMVYIPTDMLPLMQLSPSAAATAPPTGERLQVVSAPTPHFTRSGEGRLRENLFSALVYLQTTPVRLEKTPKTGETPPYPYLSAKDKRALVEILLPGETLEAELEFLLHLGQRAGFLTLKHGRLKPERDPTRAWLQSQPQAQIQQLQNTWRADPSWNELWRTPGLSPQPTGWENSSLRTRSKILDFLAQAATSTEEWLSLQDFIAAIKRTEPDFQRPDGNYESWYIYNPQGQPLMGFAHWDEVEGGLIRYLITHILWWLGVVELGMASETASPAAFRITPSGWRFLHNLTEPEAAESKTPLLRVDTNFYAVVPAQVSLYDRFQLARFAQLERREPQRVVYRITQASVSRALKNGVAADQITTFLARATQNQTPLKVIETVLTWGARQNTAKLEPVTLLRLSQPDLLAELRQHPTLSRCLGEIITPTTIVIPSDKVAEIRRLLTELGYLE